MNERTYMTHWGFREKGRKRKGLVYELLIDCPYFFHHASIKDHESPALIPPLSVTNEFLEKGGSQGGMSPGITWRPFRINEEEHAEIVAALLTLDTAKARKKHPYCPHSFMIDQQMNSKYEDSERWLNQWMLKYRGIDEFVIFRSSKKYPLIFQGQTVAWFEVYGKSHSAHYTGLFKPEPNFPYSHFCIADKLSNTYPYIDEQSWYKPENIKGFEIIDQFDFRRIVREIFTNKDKLIAFGIEFQKLEPKINLT